MRYTVGDLVMVRNGLVPLGRYTNDGVSANLDHCMCAAQMMQYCGRIAQISRIVNDRYKLDIDEGRWYWVDGMLCDIPDEDDTVEPANDEEFNQFLADYLVFGVAQFQKKGKGELV